MRSWSFISRMRVILWETGGKTPIEEMEGKGPQVVGEARTLNLGPIHRVGPYSGRPRKYLPAFGEMSPT